MFFIHINNCVKERLCNVHVIHAMTVSAINTDMSKKCVTNNKMTGHNGNTKKKAFNIFSPPSNILPYFLLSAFLVTTLPRFVTHPVKHDNVFFLVLFIFGKFQLFTFSLVHRNIMVCFPAKIHTSIHYL